MDDIQKFNQNYIENLGNNLEFYLHYLSTMAKFHKYSAEDLAGLSVYAPQNFSAVASPEVWKKHFHRSISKNARGVDIFRDGKKITVYDVSETEPPDKISLWEYSDDLHKKFLDAVVIGDFSTPDKILKIAENLISQTDLSDDDKEFAKISIAIVILERLNQSQNNSAEFRRNIESLRRQLINLNFDGRNYKILTDIIQKNSQKVLDAFQKSVQSFSTDIMDFDLNAPDLSLPENNPLLKTLGVIEVPEVQKNFVQSEKNNQNIVSPAFIEEKFSSDDHVTVLVGENFPDSWIGEDNDKRRENFIQPLENLALPLHGDWYNENEFDIRDDFRYWRFFFDSRDNAEKFIEQANSYLDEKFSDFQNVSADSSDKKIEPEVENIVTPEIDFSLDNFSVGQQNLFGDFPETQLTPEELLKSAKLFSDDSKDKFRAEFFGHYINLSRAQSYYEERQGNFKISIPPSSSNKKLLHQLTKLAEKIDGSVDTSDQLYPVFYFQNLDNARTFAKSLEFLFDNETSKVNEDLRTSAEISRAQAEFEKKVKAEQQEKQLALNHLGNEKFSFDDIPDGAGFETDDGIFTFNKNHDSFYNIDAHYFVEMDGILDRALTRMWRFGDVNKAVEAVDYELNFDKIVWRDEQQATEVKNFLKNDAYNWTLVFDVYNDGSEILRGADAEKAIREKISNSKNSVEDSEFNEGISENNQSDIQTQISENISPEHSIESLLKDATIEPVIYTSPDTGKIYHTHYPDGFSVEYSTFNIRDGYHGNGNSSGYEYSSKSFRDAFQYVQNHKNDTDKFFLGNDDVVAHYKIIKNNPHPLALGETLYDFNFSTKQEIFFDEKIQDFVKDIVPEKISEVTKKTPYEIAFDTFEVIKQKYNNHEISIDKAVSDADFALQQFKNSSMILDSRKVDTLQSFVDSFVDEQKKFQKNSTDIIEINFDKKILDEANSADSNLEHFSNYFTGMEKVLKR